MKPEDAVALFLGAGKQPWTDFEAAPVEASRQLHVNAHDVTRGRIIDEWTAEQTRIKAVSDHLKAQRRKPLAPYGQTMKPEMPPPSDAPSMTAWDGPQQWKGPTIPEAMTGGALMGGLGMMGGALGRAAWKPLLAMDIGNAVHAVASKLLGHDENIVPPYDFKYGMRLPETLLGYGDSPEARLGELVGFFSGVSPLRALERPIAAGIRSMKPGVPESNRLEYRKEVPQFTGGGLAKAAQWALPALTKAWAPSVVKPKGGQWLVGSVENALRGLKQPPTFNPELPDDAPLWFKPNDASMNSWIEGPLTKYVKTRMASPEDEVRRLAEENVLHFVPRQMGYSEMQGVGRARDKANMSGLATSRLAKDWERISDMQVRQGTYRMLDQTPINFNLPDAKERQAEALRKLGGEYAVQNPDTVVYKAAVPRMVGTDLGFDHLVDELKNALDPNSGLPRHLMLTPDAVKNMSMEKAVRRVADINAWRAAQAVEAESKNAESILARPALRQYEDGWRWLSNPDTATDEGMSLAKDLGRRGGWCTQEEDAAITYGSGRNQLHVLVDPEGRPHVQIQTQKKLADGLQDEEFGLDAYLEQYPKNASLPYDALVKDWADWSGMSAEEVLNEKPVFNVEQLKPPENSWGGARVAEYTKRNPEYKSLVQQKIQDFVKNPPVEGVKQWGDVKDFSNTGLVDLEKFKGKNPVYNKLFEAYPEQRYITQQEMNTVLPAADIGAAYLRPENFAQGGSVHAPDVVKQFLSVQL